MSIFKRLKYWVSSKIYAFPEADDPVEKRIERDLIIGILKQMPKGANPYKVVYKAIKKWRAI